MKELVVALLLWISGMDTGYNLETISGRLDIIIVSENKLEEVCGEYCQKTSQLIKKNGGGKEKLHAVYSGTERTIYISEGFDIDNKEDQGILLHELMHHIQFINKISGKKSNPKKIFECFYTHESEATYYETLWRHENGMNIREQLGMLVVYTRMCEGKA